MGNASSNADGTAKVGTMGRLREDMKLYRLVDLHGGGELIPWMRYAQRSGDESIIDGYVELKVSEFMYNQGKGKLVTVTELVKIRNKERNAMLGAFSRKKGKGKSGPNVLDEFNQEGENVGDLKKALKLLDGGGKGGKSESKYREICWKNEERGSMGETLLGVCLMQGTDIHNKLALKLLDNFPKLVNDINISEDYYGLSPLHQAIVNQDVRMVAILLRRGADVNQRCYGAFFCAEDQKSGRTDSLEHENVDLPPKTTYTGHMYFGEYPLSFAACMNHPDCYRLLIAYKAHSNAQDTNGNTVLHMCVIHEKLDMFREAVEKGASLRIMNNQRLTPLTLAAKLGRVKETSDHLDLMDGLLEELLESKWTAYAWKSWTKSLSSFTFYYFFFFFAFMTRPFSLTTEDITMGFITQSGYRNGSISEYVFKTNEFEWEETITRCHLIEYTKQSWINGYFRFACEMATLGMIAVQCFLDFKDIRRIGHHKWLYVYGTFPEKLSYKFSFVLVLLVLPCRALCASTGVMLVIDNVLSCIAVVLTTLHFLFYCRAINFIGPFVHMIFTIIHTDILRFLIIYPIFCIGFSQAFYTIFKTCQRRADIIVAAGGVTGFSNCMSTAVDALLRTFLMTVNEFMSFYADLAACNVLLPQIIGKILFMIFQMTASILLLNLVIAMMTRTYEMIFFQRKQWKRQWAQVILMLELSVDPADRLRHLLSYSRPTGTNKRARSYVVSKKIHEDQLEEFEKKEKEEKMEFFREEKRIIAKRKRNEAEARAENRQLTGRHRSSIST